MDYKERLNKSIPGGAHTYSRGHDQFPENSPQILTHGKGCYVFDVNGRKILDYGMGLRAVNIGYAEDEIDAAAYREIKKGNNLTRPSTIELDAAELMIDLIDSVDMVKFAKNGSAAVTAAIKLARAYTGRDLVALCAEQPFFSFDDWFISSTDLQKGIPSDVSSKTKKFSYNNIESLEFLVMNYPGQIACVILEAASTEEPKDGFLSKVEMLCKKNGIVFILDEMITGFRWDIGGAQSKYGVRPDLSTFGKAMANGFSVACVAGKREIMELGSIEQEGRERVFLLSSTHGAEMSSLGAFVETIEFMKRNNVIEHLWKYGAKLKQVFNEKINEYDVADYFKICGIDCSPYYVCLDASGSISLEMRTLFAQEMIKAGVMMPWIALSYRHGNDEIELTKMALDRALQTYKQALKYGVAGYLNGQSIKPVFRKYN